MNYTDITYYLLLATYAGLAMAMAKVIAIPQVRRWVRQVKRRRRHAPPRAAVQLGQTETPRA
jgi:hypothetical protein